jgi:AbrB family looped-hinge helix DNA binding protein
MMPRVLGVVTLDKKGRAVFPLALRQELGLVDGTQLLVERTDDGTYELVPAELVPRDQLYFHSAQMRERVEQAERSFREGTSARTVGEKATKKLLDSLKSG